MANNFGIDFCRKIRYNNSRMIFENRDDAGRQTAEKLKKYANKNVIIIALPRGGVPVGYQIAEILHGSLDVLPVRKIGSPQNPEYGIGAVAPGDVLYVDVPAIRHFDISPREVAVNAEKEIREMERREKLYRSNRNPLKLRNKIVILTDDGLATGVSVKAAILSLKRLRPKKIILAVPGCPTELIPEISELVDEFICLDPQEDFNAVGNLYKYFPQISDEEVVSLLSKSQSLLKTSHS